MKVIRVSIIIFLYVVSLIFCRSKPTDGIYLIPKGYVGEVVILYNQPDGETPETENGLFVYRIPDNGVLKVKTGSVKGRVNQRYFYINSEGEVESLEYLYPGHYAINMSRSQRASYDNISREEYESKIFIMAFEAGTCGTLNSTSKAVSFRSFLIGTPKDNKLLYEKVRKRITALQKNF